MRRGAVGSWPICHHTCLCCSQTFTPPPLCVRHEPRRLRVREHTCPSRGTLVHRRAHTRGTHTCSRRRYTRPCTCTRARLLHIDSTAYAFQEDGKDGVNSRKRRKARGKGEGEKKKKQKQRGWGEKEEHEAIVAMVLHDKGGRGICKAHPPPQLSHPTSVSSRPLLLAATAREPLSRVSCVVPPLTFGVHAALCVNATPAAGIDVARIAQHALAERVAVVACVGEGRVQVQGGRGKREVVGGGKRAKSRVGKRRGVETM